MTQNELSFISTDTLVEELLGRFDHAVFCGVSTGLRGGNADQYFRRYVGDLAQCSWLCEILRNMLFEDFHIAVAVAQGCVEEDDDC